MKVCRRNMRCLPLVGTHERNGIQPPEMLCESHHSECVQAQPQAIALHGAVPLRQARQVRHKGLQGQAGDGEASDMWVGYCRSSDVRMTCRSPALHGKGFSDGDLQSDGIHKHLTAKALRHEAACTHTPRA